MRAIVFISLAAALVGAGEATTLNSTETQDTPKIMCRIPMYMSARASYIDDGIKHLEGLSGNATLGHQEGGGWCFRYSCSWASGIYGCNDNQFDVEVPWSTLAAYAKDINNNCSWVERGVRSSSTTWVRGQAFDSGGWNVIVGLKDNEDC